MTQAGLRSKTFLKVYTFGAPLSQDGLLATVGRHHNLVSWVRQSDLLLTRIVNLCYAAWPRTRVGVSKAEVMLHGLTMNKAEGIESRNDSRMIFKS